MTGTTTAPPARDHRAPAAGGPTPGPPGTARRWAADLAMGARFAVSGGREGWLRTALTAVGVGLGVAVLLVAASVPHMLGAREARTDARENYGFSEQVERSDRSALYDRADTTYHGERIRGRLLQPDGDHPPVPPGVTKLPGPGEMAVSPALRDLLRSPEGELLRERLPYDIVGTVAKEGLAGPGELMFYAGRDDLTDVERAYRIDQFDQVGPPEPLPPVLLLLITVICVVLLLPVGAFIGAAVRFGGEARDRRLAALRLVGTDARATRRIAAGEAATAALFGLVIGTGMFLALRPAMSGMRMRELSVFTSDVQPSWLLAGLIAVAVPGCAVLVTLLALRGVVIEPLGVVRKGQPRRRRLWWRIIPPATGLACLAPLLGGSLSGDGVETTLVAAGIVLILTGVTALLPWLVEAVVRRLRGGALPFQLAVRRLQLDSGTAARAVSGITVAVAGSVALAGLFGAVAEQDRRETGQDPSRAQMVVSMDTSGHDRTARVVSDLADARGVHSAWGLTDTYALEPGVDLEEAAYVSLMVADCAALRKVARLPSCTDGDVFVAPATGVDREYAAGVKPGDRLDLAHPVYVPGEEEPRKPESDLWTVPEDARVVKGLADPRGQSRYGVLLTPGAMDTTRLPDARADVFVRLDPAEPDAMEHVRNAAAALGPEAYTMNLTRERVSSELDMIQRGLYVGAVGVLLLIGASMIVSTLEQLRERKRLLSVLVAFGTRRSTLAWSVLWQTAVPVLLGLALAALTGAGLGAVLLRIADLPAGVDWAALGGMTGLGGALIVLVTVLSMPALWRLMRPDGLRTE